MAAGYGAAIGAVIKMGGVGTKAYGTYAAGQAEANAIRYNNAIAGSANGINQASFQFDIDRQISAGESFLATQRTAISKSGIALNGSAIEVMIDSAKNIELDTFRLTFAKDIAQYEHNVASRDAEITAKFAKKNARISAMSGVLTAGQNAMAKKFTAPSSGSGTTNLGSGVVASSMSSGSNAITSSASSAPIG